MKKHISIFDTLARVTEGESFAETLNDMFNEHLEEDVPFVVMDVGDIVRKVTTWSKMMPRVKLFYAVKCNDHPYVLKLLNTLGTGFDCATLGEFQRILDMGVDPSRIIFAHPCKLKTHLRAAKSHLIDLMTFDNKFELEKIKYDFPEARLIIRIRSDALLVGHSLGSKFGVIPESAPILLQAAKDLDLNVVGVTFHVGSECMEPEAYVRAIKSSREVFDEAKKYGYNFNLLDIGGGFLGKTGTSLEETAFFVNQALEKYFPHENEVEVIGEPGTYIVASAFTLLTKIISKQCANLTENLSPFSYYINEGIYGTLNVLNYGHKGLPCVLKKIASSENIHSSTIWGPTCDSVDLVYENIYLPELNVGDCLYWPDMGAYTIAVKSKFNSLPPANVYMVVPSLHGPIMDGSLTDLEMVEAIKKLV